MFSAHYSHLAAMATEGSQLFEKVGNYLKPTTFGTLDIAIIIAFFVIVVGIGLWASRSAGQSSSEFFLGGRGMPWWLLGVSMVACTFSADTPNLVAGMVREAGVVKNWSWWAFLITGMVTVFIYAKLWRRSALDTDLGFYELRYSGKAASFLRGFRAIYLGVFFNLLIMATVTLAIIKYGQLMFGLSKVQCVVFGSLGVAIYATLGGIKGCIWADFFQYAIAMFGAVYAAVVAVQKTAGGNLSQLLTNENVASKLDIFPKCSDITDINALVPLLIIPLAVQWWACWYPGAEPGGGGYIAQRMLSAKDEKNAVGATLFFNFAHYALRPWPWIVVALASLILYPNLDALKTQFGHVDPSIIAHDIAYPAMIANLGTGWIGLVIASIIAAYMSTIGTHLNWGSSYVVNDFYKRFVKPDASDKEMVLMGRICTLVLMVLAGALACKLTSATQAFDILVLSGAGSGAIYLLRWFWWRINAWTEIVAMAVSAIVAIVLVLFVQDGSLAWVITTVVRDGVEVPVTLDHATVRLLLAVIITTVAWIVTTFVAPADETKTLRNFFRKCHPGGPGWQKIVDEARAEGDMIDEKIHGQAWEMPIQILCVFLGCIGIYTALFCIGYFVYGKYTLGAILGVISIVSTVGLFLCFNKLRIESAE